MPTTLPSDSDEERDDAPFDNDDDEEVAPDADDSERDVVPADDDFFQDEEDIAAPADDEQDDLLEDDENDPVQEGVVEEGDTMLDADPSDERPDGTWPEDGDFAEPDDDPAERSDVDSADNLDSFEGIDVTDGDSIVSDPLADIVVPQRFPLTGISPYAHLSADGRVLVAAWPFDAASRRYQLSYAPFPPNGPFITGQPSWGEATWGTGEPPGDFAVAPDGRYVVYTFAVAGSRQLMLGGAGITTAVVVGTGVGPDAFWLAPDGRRVVFGRGLDQRTGIYAELRALRLPTVSAVEGRVETMAFSVVADQIRFLPASSVLVYLVYRPEDGGGYRLMMSPSFGAAARVVTESAWRADLDVSGSRVVALESDPNMDGGLRVVEVDIDRGDRQILADGGVAGRRSDLPRESAIRYLPPPLQAAGLGRVVVGLPISGVGTPRRRWMMVHGDGRGTARCLVESTATQVDWSADGRALLLSSPRAEGGSGEVLYIPLDAYYSAVQPDTRQCLDARCFRVTLRAERKARFVGIDSRYWLLLANMAVDPTRDRALVLYMVRSPQRDGSHADCAWAHTFLPLAKGDLGTAAEVTPDLTQVIFNDGVGRYFRAAPDFPSVGAGVRHNPW